MARTPAGPPTKADFELVEVDCPGPADGEALVESLLLSVDPFMRLRMHESDYVGRNFGGGGVGRVAVSRHPDFAEGALVRHFAGFRERFVSDGRALTLLDVAPDLPLEVQISALGGIGMCAYGGLLGIAGLRDGEQVFVSAAAGAVGSLAAQIAKIKGCRVVGSTGSDAKTDWLRELGLDAVINYKREDIVAAVAAATPDGIDVYFENVGGRHLDAALLRMNPDGRIPVCGMISAYNDNGSPVTGLHQLVAKRLVIKGFQVNEFPHLQDAFRHDMRDWIRSGAIRTRETVFQGIEQVPDALISIFNGNSIGKTMVRVAD
ncbi:NADP-dependent oxidoreductase [Sphingopyxis lindanitolerans]|uniref:NADP-dependent oxidoreductase n=1 Tax=Sphingopyxis lindanitolerans TaxID=2054227 RepID=UPI00130501C5|nr:NADP-dependent oxidoreductase [Sphingopyxis lindanitolerans]